MTARLEYVGFNKLRPGRIHLWCPGCHRKVSNVERGEYDPPKAVLAHVWCPECANGHKDGGGVYLTASGRFMEWDDEQGEYR